ncbi:MAG TPA: type II toxin-antitoxin system RelE/ParE family toxin [Cyanobacteria bacterium UBA11369]|nr:type II toxin-antitoxin system RelE/ParE family toxin [Cyanobacteria bacterium UBA11371]HBE31898.1 type II toxin-antitoxin system RelE/ParE family toxin [Cyanobacteria bacterium UBA11368]HBE53115.1 type II toxin-antitoxin system RelE/ParE family toxin [Cyanobacteria bacterium UBA11369]
MTYRLIIKDRAEQDLRQQAEYILLNGNADAAVRFLSAAETTFAQLATMPRIGKVTQLVLSRLGEVRQWRIREFEEHLIFYRIQETTIEILRVLHGSRDLADVLSELDREV